MPLTINSLKILINGEFWLGLPKNLNDPFEGEFKIKPYDKLPKKNLIEFTYNLNPEFLNKKSIGEKLLEIENDKNIFHNDLHSILKIRLKEKYGVTSFSYTKDDILMWSHYSDSNKGFCIMFDKNSLFDSLKYPKEWINFKDVEYNSTIAEAELEISKTSISFKNEKTILISKLKVWKRERETRLFTIFPNSTGDRRVKFGKQCIKGIIFGERIDPNNKQTVMNIINNDPAYTKVLFFKANRDLIKRKMLIIKE